MIKKNTYYLFLAFGFIFLTKNLSAQAPTISYSPNSYTVAVNSTLPSTITPAVTNTTGGNIPLVNYSAINTPTGVTYDATTGKLFAIDNADKTLYSITIPGAVATVINSSVLFNPQSIVADKLGNIYVSDLGNGTPHVYKFNTSGMLVTTFSGYTTPYGLSADAGNNIYVADYSGGKVFKITSAGVSAALPVSAAKVTGAVAVGTTLYITYGNPGNFASVANGTTTGTAKTVLATGYFANSLTLDASNNIYDADANANTIYKITTAGAVTTPYSSGLSSPYQVTFDASGNLYEADNGTNFINISSFQKFTISPALPAGITFNTATGQISGTAPATTSAVTYTVTAYNSTSSASSTITINVIKLPALTYPANNIFTLNAAVSVTPANTGGAATACTISPALPAGLSISATGVISGTPTALSSSTPYTVTSTNGAGTTTSNTFNITVVSPPVFSYSGPNVYTKGTAITALSPSVSGGGPIISATVLPALPAGLSIGSDGTISGTPTAVSAATTYTVTATSSAGGTGTATVSIAVVNPPVFSYTGPNTYTTNKAITALSPTITSGGPITSVTISPALPAGLSISTSGIISGTPTLATATTTYTITATNSAGGIGTASVTITVADPPVFSYTGPNIYTTGTAITNLSPTITSGGPITSASVSPALPAGLSLSSAGVISGTPTAITAVATYTITTANSAGGTGTATVSITVNAPAPALTYASPNTFTVGTAVTLTPSNSGGTPTSATISPALPAGLSLSSTGVISGTPTAVSASASYTVTATNTGGAVNSNAFTITVNPQKPAFTYTTPVTLNVGTAYTQTPTSTGGAATFTVSPGLPAGLAIDGPTGTISGTPTAYTATANYVVTGINVSGSSTFSINITVNQMPVLAYSPNSYTFTVGTAVPSTIIPSNTGGAVNATGFGTGTALGPPGNGPQGMAFDASGNLYVANNGGRVKKYTNAAGNAVVTGPNSFTTPVGLVFDASGNAYVLDQSAGTITKVNSGGTAVAFAGPTFTDASAIAIDANGNLYVTDYTNNTVTGITPAGTIFLTISTNLSNPTGVAIDAAGNIYALNEGNDRVTKFDKNGNYLSTPVTGLGDPYGLTIDADGNIYVGDYGYSKISIFNQSGTSITTITGLNDPEGMVVDAQGNLYVSDNTNNTVTKYPPSGGYYLSGILPPGLLFNSNTGQFTGTPAAGFASTTFTVTGVNASGKSSTTITFSCPTTSPAITYTPASNTYIVGTAITSLTPSNTGGAASSYSINTALPAGLIFNPNTGVVSGTPTAVTATATYTITATNSAGSNSTPLTLTVNPQPPIISYPGPVNYAVNIALTITPLSTGGAATFTVSPALPAGLSINGTTGVISGTPTIATAAASYTVTAVNVTASTTFVINITIVAPPVISYMPSTNSYPVNVAITPLAPANTGGPVYPAGYNAGTTFATGLTTVWGITTDASGDVFVVYPNSSGAGSCVEYNPAGMLIQNFNTSGGGANLTNPVGLVIAKDGSGTIYITGKSGKIVRFTSTGTSPNYLVSGISTYSSGGSNGLGIAIDGANNLYSADDLDGIIWKYSTVSTALTQLIKKPSTGITNPSGVTIDPGGNIDFVDYSTKSLLRYNFAGGYLSTLVTGLNNPYGVYADASGNVFVAGTTTAGTVTEYSASGTVIGNITTTLNNPRGIAESPSGTLYITDYGTGQINRYLPNFYVLSGGTPPPGLTFDPATGTFSGTPTAVFAATTYTVTAYGFGHIPVTTTVTISCYNSYDWVGTQTGGYWNNASNWRSGVVPGSANTANIGVNTAFTYPPVVSANTSVGVIFMGNKGSQAASVNVSNGFTLTVNGDITKQSDANSAPGYTANLLGAGTIAAVNLNVLANTVTATGTYTENLNSASGNLLLSGNIILTSVNSTYATNAAFTISGGLTSLTGTGAIGIVSTNNVSGSTSKLAVTGGTLQWVNATPLSGLSSVAGSNIVSLTGTGVIDYHGAAQTVYTSAAFSGLSSGVSYQGLKLSGTGAKTPNAGNLNIAGDFTNALTNDASNYITLTGTPVIFNGTMQALAGGAGLGIIFKNVSFSGAGTKTMASGLFSVVSAGTLNMLGSSNSTILNAGGLLTLISDVNGSATVPAFTGPAITGNVNVQRFITGGAAGYRGYRLLSSPVSTSSTSGLVNINYIINSVYLTGTSGTGGGFDGGHNPSLYLFRDNLAPSNATYTSGNFRGVNNITSAPSYVIDIDGTGFNIPTGNGYLMFFRGDRSMATYTAETTPSYVPTSTTLTAVGTLNQGQITVKDWFTPSSSNLDYSTISGTPTVEGFNLVGNPYASSIDWDTYNSTTINIGIYAPSVTSFIYVLDSKSKNYNVYQAGMSGSGTLATSGSNIIPSGQGFFVVASSTAGQVVFNESAKTSSQATAASGNLFLALQQKPKAATDRYMHLSLIKDSVNKDGIILSLNKTASANYTAGEDAAYKTGNGYVSLASRSADGIELAINATPYPTKTQPIPLVVGASTDGSYTFDMDELKHIPDVYDVWLKDAYLKDSLDIRHNPTYIFSILHADTNSYGANRFSLIIRKDQARNVHLLNFTASKATNSVKTAWTVENEEDYTGFSLQKSNDRSSFTTIDTLESSSLGTYGYTDTNPQTVNYYRLQLTDVSGDITYSAVIPVMYGTGTTAKTGNSISVYPNPTNGMLHIAVNQGTIATSGLNQVTASTTTANTKTYDIRITNMTGEVLKTVTSATATWQNDMSSLLPGTYIIQVFNHGANSVVGRTTFVKL